MPRHGKLTIVADRHAQSGGVLPPAPLGLHLARPMLIGATLLFWTVVFFGIKLILS